MPLADITISKLSDDCISTLKNKRLFDDDKTAAQFAASYALAKLDLEEYNFRTFKINNPLNKWHTFDFDPDRFFRNLISLYYDGIDDVDYALRAVISIGLEEIHKQIEDDANWSIINLLP
jgi:arylsulfatase A-like enzyme